MGGGASADDPLAELSPTELVKLRAELFEKSGKDLTVDERWKNYGRTGEAIAGMLPVIGNAMSANDAYQSAVGTAKAASEGDTKGAALNAAATGVGLLGALSPLPWSRRAGDMVADASRTTRIFAGPEAKTADKKALETAELMREAQLDRSVIWRETGWGWDEKGKPFFEIDDSAARMRKDAPQFPDTVGAAVDHPELFDAVPEIAAMRYSQSAPAGGGHFYSPQPGTPGRIDVGPHSNPYRRRAVALHEMQHAADEARGGEFGSNPRNPTAGDRDAAERLARQQGVGRELDELAAARKALDALYNPREGSATGDPRAAIQRMNEAEAALSQALQRAGLPPTLNNLAYRVNPGEVRARNVETRADFNADERRAIPPWETIDVDESWIGGGGQASGPSATFLPAPEGMPATLKAQDMRREGVPMDRIWRETQRLIGPDGTVLREIRDQPISLRSGLQVGDQASVGEFVNHPQLFKVFPELAERDMTITGSRDKMGRPVARTDAQGGIELNPEYADVRGPLAKLFQYQIGTASGLPMPLRHGAVHAEAALDRTRGAADALDPLDKEGRAAVDAYLDNLAGHRDQFEMMRELEQFAGRGNRSDAADRLGKRNAGNVLATAASQRSQVHPDQMSAWPLARKSLTADGRHAMLPKFEDQVVLPPADLTSDELMDFIRQWRELGVGRAIR